MPRLHFGTSQTVVALVLLGIALVLAAVFWIIAVNAGREVPQERVQAVGYALRRRWVAFLAVLLVVVVGAAWATFPYARGSAAGRTVVHVTAGQFFWSFSPSQVPAGSSVRFLVTSRDVNHGFGLYTPGGVLIAEIQAMPGYTNPLDVTINRPGRYRVLCLEYCGLAHHTMSGAFTVTGPAR